MENLSQTMPPFYLLLRYMAVESDLSRHDKPRRADERDERDAISSAMRRLSGAQRIQLRQFLEQLLSSDADDKSLARVFDDGHTYIVWHTADGPRRRLELIRALAEHAPQQ